MLHEVPVETRQFLATWQGRKPFQVVPLVKVYEGDELKVVERNGEEGTGRFVACRVTYVQELPDGLAVVALAKLCQGFAEPIVEATLADRLDAVRMGRADIWLRDPPQQPLPTSAPGHVRFMRLDAARTG